MSIIIKAATEKPLENENLWSYPTSEIAHILEGIADGTRQNNAVFLYYDGRLYETE